MPPGCPPRQIVIATITPFVAIPRSLRCRGCHQHLKKAATKEIGEPDKILLQDLLTERARLRTAIQTDTRLIGVGAAILVATAWTARVDFPINTKLDTMTNVEHAIAWSGWCILVLLAVLMLVGLFAWHMDALARDLRKVNCQITERLAPYGKISTDDHMLGRAGTGVKAAVVFLLYVLLCLCMVSRYDEQVLKLQHELSQTTPSASPAVAPATAGSKQQAP